MKKLFKIAGLVLITALLAACNNASGPSSTESFSKTTVFNPTKETVKLIAVSLARSANANEEVCEVEPSKAKEVELGNEHEYFFTDAKGDKIADLEKSDDGQYLPVYLELNEPKDGKQYLLLNQYKTDNLLESFTRYNNDGTSYETYELLLYEVVKADALDSYKFNNDTYIRTYPSANYWIDSKGYASNKLGTIITFDSDFENNFEPLSNEWVAWGWSTKNDDYNIWFCHRVVSYILHAKDGDSYQVNKNFSESASVQPFIQAVYSENPNWNERWSTGLPSGETTKWKVSEIWFYSTKKIYYNSNFTKYIDELEKQLQDIIPNCRLLLSPIEKQSYDGCMPQNSEYALCMRLESKNCNVIDVWCETIQTSLLQDAYNLMQESAPNFILNY